MLAYLDWANETERALRGRIRPAEVETLARTRKFDQLLSLVGRFGPDMQFEPVNGLLSAELDERDDAFRGVAQALQDRIGRWSFTARFFVFDTNVYIEHADPLESMDFQAITQARSDDVHLLIPMVVVDELDRLKKVDRARSRARTTLRMLDRLCHSSTGPVALREAGGWDDSSTTTPRGSVTIEILLDPPGHTRLPRNDEEIIDRVLAAQPLAARDIGLITYDTGMAMRARNSGLPVTKLDFPDSKPDTARG